MSYKISFLYDDISSIFADAESLERDFGFTQKITSREVLRVFSEWYKEYDLKR